ncbi:MAG: hypothetical protein S4CHLAM123_15000 [Chlamydiales bacterium]|nr:hypothetical protein [Chlamydiales bacterium]
MKCLSTLFLLVLLSSTTVFANIDEKYYCTPEQIEVTDSTILIHANEGSFELEALLVDQGGVFYTNEMLRCIQCRRPNPKHLCECPISHR